MNPCELAPIEREVAWKTEAAKYAWETIDRKRWNLKTRLEWLKYLDSLLARNKDEILADTIQEKSTNEHEVLIDEYIPTRSLIRYYLKNAKRILADENRSRFFSLVWGHKKPIVKKEPLGLVGVISPYNHPFSLSVMPTISAILAGNAVILKPPEETPKTNFMVSALLSESLMPFGTNNFFFSLSPDAECGQQLVGCDLVDKIYFTGSTSVGKAIAAENAKIRLIPPTLELGGSNAAIVLKDADLKLAARVILWSRFSSASCNSIKRVFVPEKIYKDFKMALAEEIAELKKTSSDFSLLHSKEMDNHGRFLDDLMAKSSKPVEIISFGKDGLLFFIKNPDDNLLILKEETFCPILPVVKVDNEKEAARRANESQFGLGTTVFTKNKKRFAEIADQLQCGGVYHNDAMTEFAQPQLAFGGWKNSGWGYAHGPEGLLEFVRLKTVVAERWRVPKLYLFPWTEWKKKWIKKFADWL